MPAVCIVLGSAKDALAEFERAQAMAPDAPVVCVNDALRTCPAPALAFATLHPEKRRRFLDGVALEGVRLFANERPAYDSTPWEIVPEKWGGTSGLYAVQIALGELGFAGSIVAGVPIDHKAGTTYARHPQKQWASGNEARYRRGWTKALPAIGARVRSMSGWTQEILGAPSRAWLEGLYERA